MDDYEKVATALLILFGALILGGLMAVHITIGNKAGFLFACSGAIVGWFSAFAILLDRPKIYLALIVLVVLCVAASIGLYVR